LNESARCREQACFLPSPKRQRRHFAFETDAWAGAGTAMQVKDAGLIGITRPIADRERGAIDPYLRRLIS